MSTAVHSSSSARSTCNSVGADQQTAADCESISGLIHLTSLGCGLRQTERYVAPSVKR